MDLSLLGQRIKEERKRQGLTLETLSEALCISRNFLWEIESGRKTPALNTLYNLSERLNVSIDYLLGLTLENRRFDKEEKTERDELIERIMEQVNKFNDEELILITDILDDINVYLQLK